MSLQRAHSQASDSMAFRLLNSGLSIAELRAASPLEENAQRIVDQAVVNVGLERLVIVGDVLAAGLTFPLTDPLSVMEVQWERISKVGGAQRTMNPSARGENQLPERTIKRIPVYLTTDDFSVGIRTLKASQRIGTPLDTTMVQQATRRVNEAIEDAMINGAGVQVDGYDTPGLLNAPNVNTKSMTVNWNSATGAQIQADVLSAIATLQGKKKFGPYNLYVGTTIGTYFMTDFKANGDSSILTRLREIEAGGRNLVIKVADQLPANTAVMFQMSSDVVDIIDGQAPTVIPWTSNDGFTLFWLVMAIMIPRVRDDYDGNSGIIKFT